MSTERMTFWIEADKYGIIQVTPPIVRKFVGQPLDNLVRWMSKQPGFRMQNFGEEVPA